MSRFYTAVLIGQPNSGKTSIFRALADNKTPSGGATVDISSAEINIWGDVVRLIDLPGCFSLNPTHPAEEITTKFLMNQKIDLVINVLDASMITRGLELTVELMEMGLPMVIALNMNDLAAKRGMTVDTKELEGLIGVPVITTHALHNKGVKELSDIIYKTVGTKRGFPMGLNYTHHIEARLHGLSVEMEKHISGLTGSPRFYAIKSIENPELLPNSILEVTEPARQEIIGEIKQNHGQDPFETISYERHHLAMSMSEKVCDYDRFKKSGLGEKIDNILLNPFIGYLFVAAFFLVYFVVIFEVGSFLSALTAQPLDYLSGLILPLKEKSEFLWFTVNGAYLGFSGIIGIVLPYFLPLVLLTSIYEESGYLSRVAFLLDGMMHKIGLHGKSVVSFILGFGCSIPAIYATRMIENKRDRIITSILIPFVPCTARIAVIFALSAAFAGPFWAFVIFGYVLLIIALHGKVMSKFLTQSTGLIMDMPDLRMPTFRVSMSKTWAKIYDFVKEAFLFLIVGSIVLGWIEYFNLAVYIDNVTAPLLEYVLGLPDKLGSTLVFGFFRKELILVMANQAMGVQSIAQLPLTNIQVVVFIVFVAFYFPCFTTFVVLLKEFGWKVIILSALLSIVVSILSAFLFRVILTQLQNFI